MRKLFKVGLIVLIIGVLITFAGFAGIGFDFNKISTREIVTDVVEISDEFVNIEIDVTEENITFIECEEGESKVILTHNKAYKSTIKVKGDTLVISEKGITKWTDFIGEGGDTPKLEIYLPAGEYGKLNIDMASADVSVDERFVFDKYDIDSASGDIKISGAEPSVVNIDASSGSVYLLDMKCGDIDIDTSSGDVCLENVTAGSVDIDASSGDISFINSLADGIDVDTASGDIVFNMSDADSIKINTASGDVSGTLLSGKDFDVDTASGDVDVPNDGEGGKCNIDTASGDVSICIAQ